MLKNITGKYISYFVSLKIYTSAVTSGEQRTIDWSVFLTFLAFNPNSFEEQPYKNVSIFLFMGSRVPEATGVFCVTLFSLWKVAYVLHLCQQRRYFANSTG